MPIYEDLVGFLGNGSTASLTAVASKHLEMHWPTPCKTVGNGKEGTTMISPRLQTLVAAVSLSGCYSFLEPGPQLPADDPRLAAIEKQCRAQNFKATPIGLCIERGIIALFTPRPTPEEWRKTQELLCRLEKPAAQANCFYKLDHPAMIVIGADTCLATKPAARANCEANLPGH